MTETLPCDECIRQIPARFAHGIRDYYKRRMEEMEWHSVLVICPSCQAHLVTCQEFMVDEVRMKVLCGICKHKFWAKWVGDDTKAITSELDDKTNVKRD
jgi:hypothetical protein